ncbi:hypothetical protein E5288_WYG003495 [Bos mutus]|uniref:GAGE domain-containing protein n=1 Tax=Bos mutus TaxID=72004 RepID=A0A6B0S9D7_9CETA|nr:hypothetical protein [Bos mutus]
MSGQVASTLGPTKQDCSQVDEPVVDQQPSVEQPQQAEPPAEIQDITPRKEEVHGEDPVNRDEEEEKDPFEAELMHFFKDSVLEAALQQLALAKTGGEGGDGPDVREEFASNTEPVEMPEAAQERRKNQPGDTVEQHCHLQTTETKTPQARKKIHRFCWVFAQRTEQRGWKS